jgi:hypothetical protein
MIAILWIVLFVLLAKTFPQSVERHLASEQHGVDPNIAKIIAYLNERVDRLEKLEQQIQ